jgi:hypothetical protein
MYKAFTTKHKHLKNLRPLFFGSTRLSSSSKGTDNANGIYEEWKKLAQTQLKGKSPDSLVVDTAEVR